MEVVLSIFTYYGYTDLKARVSSCKSKLTSIAIRTFCLQATTSMKEQLWGRCKKRLGAHKEELTKHEEEAPTNAQVKKSSAQIDENSKWEKAKRLIMQHRFNFNDEKVGFRFLPNNSFDDCSLDFTKLFHKLTHKLFSTAQLTAYAPMMKDRARQLIKQEKTLDDAMVRYCYEVLWPLLSGEPIASNHESVRIFSSCRAKRQWQAYDKKIMQYQAKIHLRLMQHLRADEDPNNPVHRLFEDQIFNVQQTLMALGRRNIVRGLICATLHYAEDPKLKMETFQHLKQRPSNESELSENVLKIVVEATRIAVGFPVERGNSEIPLGVNDPNLVGPYPHKFNVNRLKKLPKSWLALPGMLFAGGAHACPGWRNYMYMTEAFLVTLIENYFIKKANSGHGRLLRIIPRDPTSDLHKKYLTKFAQ